MTLKLCATALILASLLAILSEMGFRAKRAVGALCIVILLLGIGESLGEIISWLGDVSAGAGVSEICRSAIKVVGVGYAFGISSSICEELGERGIASMLTSVGRVEIFLVVFPYFKEIVKMGLGLLE